MKIACIGGAHIDRHGLLEGPLILGTSNPGAVISPVKTESEHIDVVPCGPVDIAHRNLGDGLWKASRHV